MKRILITVTLAISVSSTAFAQSHINVPKVVKNALAQQFPGAKNITWESEKGNYEANWGGKSGEDNSVLYTPSGKFIEAGKAISIDQLPAPAVSYVKSHYKGAAIDEPMQITNANGKVTYEVEVYGKDILFDEHGNVLKTGKE